jgi:hypothetical protein
MSNSFTPLGSRPIGSPWASRISYIDDDDDVNDSFALETVSGIDVKVINDINERQRYGSGSIVNCICASLLMHRERSIRTREREREGERGRRRRQLVPA